MVGHAVPAIMTVVGVKYRSLFKSQVNNDPDMLHFSGEGNTVWIFKKYANKILWTPPAKQIYCFLKSRLYRKFIRKLNDAFVFVPTSK